MREAASHGRLGPWQLQALIASLHANAPTAADTDWAQIADLYAMLERIQPSPVVTLNRAVAVAMADGPHAGLALLESMHRRGLAPNVISYSAAISACEKGGQWQRALSLLRSMVRHAVEAPAPPSSPTVPLCLVCPNWVVCAPRQAAASEGKGFPSGAVGGPQKVARRRTLDKTDRLRNRSHHFYCCHSGGSTPQVPALQRSSTDGGRYASCGPSTKRSSCDRHAMMRRMQSSWSARMRQDVLGMVVFRSMVVLFILSNCFLSTIL